MTVAGEASKKPRSRLLARLATGGVYGLAGLLLAGLLTTHLVVREFTPSLPPTPDLATLPVSAAVVDRAGLLLRPFTTPDGRWRLPVSIADVDRHFIDMLVAYEDRHFEDHGGIDWPSMLRAAGQFVLAGGHIVSGGSTLTDRKSVV